MGKKALPEPSKNKKNKTKYKEMFPELATLQEEVVNKKHENHKYEPKRVIYQNSQSEVQLQVLEHHNKNLDQICQTVHKLLSKNKVSAKNAFDVPLIDLEDLPDFAESLENQFAWKRLSSTLQNDYKIYGYRVDAIHSITYNILHTMARRQQEIDVVQNAAQPQNPMEQQVPIKIAEGSQSQHIQRKLENLDLTALELALGVDPILERNKRKFDQLANNSMLLDTLPIDDFLTLQLAKSSDIHKIYPPWGQYNGPWKLDDPLMAFCQLSNFRSKLQEDLQGKMKDQEIYEMLLDQKENHFSGNYLEIKMEADHIKKNMFKDHKLKNIYLRDENDLMDDAKTWMQTQRRLMNMKKGQPKIENSFKFEIKIQDPANRIDFDFAISSRQQIFKKQNEKMEFHQQIQDRFLLANKLPYSFDIITYPLTLKQNPALPKAEMQAETQVDVRRQMVSILQAKRRMHDLIHQRSTFTSIYSTYSASEDISPALCFLTILHLANQNNLSLQQLDESNFYIH